MRSELRQNVPSKAKSRDGEGVRGRQQAQKMGVMSHVLDNIIREICDEAARRRRRWMSENLYRRRRALQPADDGYRYSTSSRTRPCIF